MSLFDVDHYKTVVNNWIETQPNGGYGQLRRLSEFLGVNSVVMSQIFRGERDLTLEQAVSVSEFIGLTELERDYFLLLVQEARAGSHELKKVLARQLAGTRQSANALKNRIKHEKLNDEDRATFYSNWYYSAVRLSSSIHEMRTVSDLAEYLGLERSLVAKVVDFLLQKKLMVQGKQGLDMGPSITHIGHDSPFVLRHHVNWRLQGLKEMETGDSDDLFYTGPMALSEEAAKKIRTELMALVAQATKIAAPSDSETLRCLNIDWFGVGRD